jgi:hypothetical protein
MRRCNLARGRRERVALLLALLPEQERHDAGFAALGTLQWQRVPTTHAFGLHGGGRARGLGAGGACAGGTRLVVIEVGEAGWRARAASRCYGFSVELVRMSRKWKYKRPKVGGQGFGVFSSAATFGRC